MSAVRWRDLRGLVVALVLAVAMGCSVGRPEAAPLVKAERFGWLGEIGRSVLPMQREDGKIYCSSFVIAKDTVQTAYHCLASNDGQLLVGGEIASILYADPKLDSAVLKVVTKLLRPLRAAVVQPLPGETVYSTGYAVGLRRQTQVVGKVREVQLRYVITEPMVIPGMSGGPVVNAAGEVVSMNHMSYGSEHHQLDLGLNIQLIRQYDKVFWED